jgi:hypothetical protein
VDSHHTRIQIYAPNPNTAGDWPMTRFPSCKPIPASPGLTSSPDHPQLYCFPLLFFHSSSSLCIFYVIRNKITVHFTCKCTLYYIHYVHITEYIQKHVLYGQFKGLSRVILIIYDLGFMQHL